MCRYYRWEPQFWRRMGWREFRAWIREMNRSRTVEAEQQQTDPDSWAGQGSDGWWVEQAAKRDRMRGR